MPKLFSLGAGAKLPDAIAAIAETEKIATASLTAIGGVDSLTLAYFNHDTKKYEEHTFDEFMEVTGLVGNITLKDGRPFVHAHGTFGRRDLSVLGGHLMSAKVFPLLEVSIGPTDNQAVRRFDERIGLNVIASEP